MNAGNTSSFLMFLQDKAITRIECILELGEASHIRRKHLYKRLYKT